MMDDGFEPTAQVSLGLYRHYKGNLYEVIAVGRHSETLEELVVYRAQYGKRRVWVRPAAMFLEEVDGKPRFERVAEGV